MEHFKAYLPLCWFIGNPLEQPRSIRFFQYNLLYYLLIELFIQINITDDPFEAIFEVLLEVALSFAFISALLLHKKAMPCFIATSTSFIFCENIQASLILPNLVWLLSTSDVVSYYFMAILVFYSVCMITYLIKQVLYAPLTPALVLTLVYLTLTYLGSYVFYNALF
ncbi:MAG: hypothetical protein RQ715_04510 [Methylococcales bacterium]|nr:hypothetical protein [Methylococcales bacterium]